MTTIAYKDGVMAADTLGMWAGMKIPTRKIVRIDGGLIGTAGNYVDALRFIEWYEAGADRDKIPVGHNPSYDGPVFTALVADSCGVTCWSEAFVPDPVLSPFVSIGSGCDAAMAAMHMGASAREAVHVAAKVDYYTNGDVQVEAMPPSPAITVTKSGPKRITRRRPVRK